MDSRRLHLRRSGSAARSGARAAFLALSMGLGAVFAGDTAALGAEPDTEAARQLATINERLARLNVAPHPGEFIADKVRGVRKAIKERRFSAARSVILQVLAESRIQNWRFYPFEPFFQVLSDTKDSVFGDRLSEWVDQDKDDAIPILVRAQYHIDLAWFKRGVKFARETQGDRMAAFTAYTTKALMDVDQAIKLNDQNPYAYRLKLRILHGFGVSKEFLAAFESAVAKYPGYYQLYESVLTTLVPSWGGTVEEMYAFVDKYAGSAPEQSPLKLLYLSLYRSLLNSAGVSCINQKNEADKRAACIANFMGQAIKPPLEREVLGALQLYDHTDRYQFAAAIAPIVAELVSVSGGEPYSGAILELAAGALHSTTQLESVGSERNNYVIDKYVAESWYQKRFYGNALKKYQQALNDIDLSAFPSAEERDLALGDIYERLARTHSRLHQHVETIVYETAAIRLGVTSSYEFLCYGYYQLKLYDEAITACTEGIEKAENLLSHYYRAKVYEDLGKFDAALPDFAVIAESDHNFRGRAAFQISFIYAKTKDYRRSLEALDKYSFLFDAKTQNKNDVAAAYNNRCFDHMELGDLKKALDDCTESLRYGSLPDAYRKQQELVKRLKGPNKDL